MHWAIPFDRQRHEALRGVSRRRSLELLLAGRVYPEEQMLELMERKNHYYQALLTQGAPQDLLPGVRHLLEAVRAADGKIALGSASQNAREVVQRLHIASSLDALADGYSVVRPGRRQTCSSLLLVSCVCACTNASSSRTSRRAWKPPKSPGCTPWASAP